MNEETSVRVQTREWLSEVEVGTAIHHRNLTIFPLLWKGGTDSAPVVDDPSWPAEPGGRYQLLADAVAAEEARVEEVSEGGEVPFLGIDNRGGTPILVPEGEILIGAKQNRVVNLTVLVAAGSTFKLPVSCVERGRWHYRSRAFEPAAFAHPKLRDLKVRSAQRSRRVMGLALADQGAVWDEVDDHLFAFSASSPTSDFCDSYAVAEDYLEDFRQKIELPTEACGFIAAQSGRIVGLDLFDTPTTMQKLWTRLSDAYFLEAARLAGEPIEVSRDTAAGFLERVIEGLEEAATQPELGIELEIAAAGISGSALYYEGAVCHLSAFQAAEAL